MKSETLTISLEKSTQDSIPFYSPSQPFGFVDEAAHNAQPSLNIFELNSGFNVPYWYASEPITQIQQDENGCFLDSDALVQTLWEKDGAVQPPQRFVPLCFKAAVPHAGNYRSDRPCGGRTASDFPRVPVPCVERLCAAGRSFVHLFFCQCFAHHSQWKNSGF